MRIEKHQAVCRGVQPSLQSKQRKQSLYPLRAPLKTRKQEKIRLPKRTSSSNVVFSPKKSSLNESTMQSTTRRYPYDVVLRGASNGTGWGGAASQGSSQSITEDHNQLWSNATSLNNPLATNKYMTTYRKV